MNPEKVTLEEKLIVGISTRTNNKNEQSPVNGKLMKLWGDFFEKGVMAKVPNQKENTPMFGVYGSYESDFNGDYTVTAGVEVALVLIDSEYEFVKIESGDYLRFSNKGEMPDVVIETWQEIWEYFADDDSARKYATDFELYKSEDEVEIYISVK